jgi:hypothetical protein
MALSFFNSCSKREEIPSPDTGEKLREDLISKNEETLVIACPAEENSIQFLRYQALYREAFSRMGYTIEVFYFPPLRSLKEALSGQYLGDTGRIADLNRNNEYPDLLRVDEIINWTNLYAFVVDDSIRIDHWEDLKTKPYRVGSRQGITIIETNLNNYVPVENQYSVSDSKQGLRALAAGRIDIYIDGEGGLSTLLLDEDEFKSSGISISGIIVRIDLYPYFHKKYQYLINDFIVSLKEMKEDGKFMELFTTYELKYQE